MVLVKVDTRNGKAPEAARLFVQRNNSYVLLHAAQGGELRRLVPEVGKSPTRIDERAVLSAMEQAIAREATARGGFELLAHLYTSSDVRIRREALHFMGDLDRNTDKAVPLLVHALRDTQGRFSDAYVAAGSLQRLGPAAKPAIPALMRVARDAGMPANVRQQALITLGAIDTAGEAVIPTLIEGLTHDSPTLRLGAALALEKSAAPPPRIVPALIEALEATRRRAAQYHVIKALIPRAAHARAALPLLRRLAAREVVPRDAEGRVAWEVEATAREAIRAIESAP